MKSCTPLWREADFEEKRYKTPQRRTTFGSWDVEKVNDVVAPSKFRSQNVQSTRGSDHFWQLRCRKSAWRCFAKHISKSKDTKHLSAGPLLEVEMSKKCTRLWREAHFEVKMFKALGVRTTFGSWDVEKVHGVVAQSTFRSQHVQSTSASDHFWKLRCRKNCTPLWREAHFEVKMFKTLGFGPLLEVQMSLRFTTLHYIPLHYTPLHYTTGHYTTLDSSTLHYTTLNSSTLHYTKLHYTTPHYNR